MKYNVKFGSRLDAFALAATCSEPESVKRVWHLALTLGIVALILSRLQAMACPGY